MKGPVGLFIEEDENDNFFFERRRRLGFGQTRGMPENGRKRLMASWQVLTLGQPHI